MDYRWRRTFSTVCFGGTRSGSVPTDKQFTGQRLDDTGLYYYGARYYDPTIGRFISADTIIPNPADPQSINRYSYCYNNPLKYTDPSGHIVYIGGFDVRVSYSYLNSLNNGIYGMSIDQAMIEAITSQEFQAYNEFRNMGGKAETMARSMEINEDNYISIETSSPDEQLECGSSETKEDGNNFTIRLHPELYVTDILDRRGLVIFDRVKEEILDINADLDYVSATAAGAVNAVPLKKWWKSIQYGYNVIDGLIRGHSMPDIAADTVLGGTPNLLWNFFYGFFDELLGQQDYYDRNTGVYPFRNEKE